MNNKSLWANRRRQVCLRKDVIHLNAGSCSPLPQPVYKALSKLRLELARDPVDFIWHAAAARLTNSRQALASYLKCTPAEILLLPNASYGVNTLLLSYPFAPGDEVLISSQEYEHFLALWRRLEQTRHIVVRKVPIPLYTEQPSLTPQAIVNLFAQLLTPRTVMMFFSHITSPTGLILPAAALCNLAAKHGITSVVDGAHAVGHLPLSLREIDADFYVANIHKWLMGPVGSAFLYMRAAMRPLIKPMMTTRFFELAGMLDSSAVEKVTPEFVLAHEYHGTADRTAQMVLTETIAFREALGDAEVFARMHELTKYCRSRLENLPFPIVSHAHPLLQSAMLAIDLSSVGPLSAPLARQYFRQKHGIELAFPLLGKRPVLRLSNAWFISKRQIDKAIACIGAADWQELLI